MKQKIRGGLLVPVMLSLASCTPGKAYVDADQATYAVIAPEYVVYVEADAKLTKEQRARRLRTLLTWKLRIDKAGGGN